MNSTYSDENRDRIARVVPVELLGITFSVRTDESPEYIQGLVTELRDRFSRLSAGAKVADPLKLAILSNLLILDEMRRGSGRKGGTGVEFEASSLLASLDRKLGDLGL